jgi:hypothetical protein
VALLVSMFFRSFSTPLLVTLISGIDDHLDAHKILVDCQHGFRAKRSCETQLLTLSHELAENLHKGIQLTSSYWISPKHSIKCPIINY